jgi:hypothetical protein
LGERSFGRHRAEEVAEPTRVHRLDQMKVDPGVPRAAAVGIIAVLGQGNERRVAQSRLFLERLGDLEAVHARQAEIE